MTEQLDEEQDEEAQLLEGVNIESARLPASVRDIHYTEDERQQIQHNLKIRELVNLKGKTKNIQKIKTQLERSENIVAADLSELIYG